MEDSAHADLLNRTAVRLQAEGRSRESLEAFQQAVVAYRTLGDRQGEGRCLNGVGAVYKDLGETGKAAEYLEQALALRRETGDSAGEAITLLTLGPVYARLGRAALGRDCLLQALKMTRQLRDREREGQALYNLGVLARLAGEFGEAYGLIAAALELARQRQDYVESSKCLNALAVACADLGKRQEALSYSAECLRIAEATGNPRLQSAALTSIGFLLMDTDQGEASVRFLERAVRIDLATDASGSAAETMALLAVAYANNHDLTRAHDFAARSLAVSERRGDLAQAADAKCTLGRVLVEQGQHQQAWQVLEEALALSRRTGLRDVEGRIQYTMGLALDRSGQPERALPLFETALEFAEQSYAGLQREDLRLSYFNSFSIQQIYLVYTASLVRCWEASGNPLYSARAFAVCERRRARGLREFLEEKLLGRGAREPAAPAAGNGEDPARRRFRSLLEQARPRPLQEIQARLPADTALLEYSIHNELGYVWAVSREGYTLASLPGGGQYLRPQVDRLRQAILSEAEGCFPLAHELYETLVAPVAQAFQGKTTVLISPDYALHLLPFQVLLTGRQPSAPGPGRPTAAAPGRERENAAAQSGDAIPEPATSHSLGPGIPYLVERYAISYAPSASVFFALDERRPQERPDRRDLVAFAPVDFPGGEEDGAAISRLPGTLAEVNEIAALFRPEQVVLKLYGAATKQAALAKELSDFRYVHFATHGFASDDDPEGGAIILRGDSGAGQLLLPAEIAGLDLDADMAVLSACETAMGKVAAGEGVLGLVRAFFCAGARSVCASLWRVDDLATALLMRTLYEKLTVSGLSKPHALRAAQLELIRHPRWSAPRFWGAFMLAGR